MRGAGAARDVPGLVPVDRLLFLFMDNAVDCWEFFKGFIRGYVEKHEVEINFGKNCD